MFMRLHFGSCSLAVPVSTPRASSTSVRMDQMLGVDRCGRCGGRSTDHCAATWPLARGRALGRRARVPRRRRGSRAGSPGRWRSHSAVTRRCISMRVRASSALNGSSSSSRSGSRTSARASETRCACPPESCNGQASSLLRRGPPPPARCARVLVPRLRSGVLSQRQGDVLLRPCATAADAAPGRRPRRAPVTDSSPRARCGRGRRGCAAASTCRTRCDPAARRTHRDGSSRSSPRSTFVVPNERCSSVTVATDGRSAPARWGSCAVPRVRWSVMSAMRAPSSRCSGQGCR